MSMLNTPAEIVENYRVVDEKQYIYWFSGFISSRKRKMTYTTYRYVGCELTAAQAKADALNADDSFRDINVVPAGGGQYHVIATKKTEGAWSAWAIDTSAGDDPGEEE